MAAATIGISEISQIAITVKDTEKTTAFYRDVLGLPFLFAAPGLAFFMAGSVRLMLSSVDSGDLDHPASVLYFKVPNIQEMHVTFRSRGVEFRTEPHVVHRTDTYELWLADFYDCERNTFALMEERKK